MFDKIFAFILEKIFLLAIDSFFFQLSKDVASLSFHLHCFWHEICCHLYLYLSMTHLLTLLLQLFLSLVLRNLIVVLWCIFLCVSCAWGWLSSFLLLISIFIIIEIFSAIFKNIIFCPPRRNEGSNYIYIRLIFRDFLQISRVLSLWTSLLCPSNAWSSDSQLCILNSGSLLGSSRVLLPCVLARKFLEAVIWENYCLTSISSFIYFTWFLFLFLFFIF